MNLVPSTSYSNHTSKGFTLIELLVTISIMVILVGGSIAGFITFKERQEVVETTKQIQQFVRNAETKARVSETPPTCNSTNNRLQGYLVTFDNANRRIWLTAVCGPDDRSSLTQQAIITSYDLPSGTSFTWSPGSILFYTLHQGADGPSQTIVKNGSYVYCFTVQKSGLVSDVKEAVAEDLCE